METIASLFNLAGPDLIIILFVALLLFGAKRLPELARGMGQAMQEFTKAKNDLVAQAEQPQKALPKINEESACETSKQSKTSEKPSVET